MEITTMTGAIQPHNERLAAVWSAGGKDTTKSAGVSPTRSSTACCG